MERERPAAAPGSDEELLRRAALGDVAAFARIIRLHHEAMTRAALVVTGDLDRAASATATTLLGAWLDLRRPRSPADLGAWLAARAVIEALRVAPERGGEPLDPGPATRLVDLAPGDRSLLALHLAAGLSTPEVALASQRPWAVVSRRLELLVPATGPLVRAAVDVPVPSIDADAIARRARAEEVLEQRRVVSVAVSALVGLVVVAHPYLVGILLRR